MVLRPPNPILHSPIEMCQMLFLLSEAARTGNGGVHQESIPNSVLEHDISALQSARIQKQQKYLN